MTPTEIIDSLRNATNPLRHEAAALIETLLAENERLKAHPRCEHCGSDWIYHGPPDCPNCGAPNCCEICCRITSLEKERDDLLKKQTP